jgi:hypothetical protein
MKFKSIQELYLWTIIELTCKRNKFRNFAKKTWWNIRYYKLRKRFSRNVNHVAGTTKCPVMIEMIDKPKRSVATYDRTSAIGYNQRKQWLDQVSKQEQEVKSIRAEYQAKKLE